MELVAEAMERGRPSKACGGVRSFRPWGSTSRISSYLLLASMANQESEMEWNGYIGKIFHLDLSTLKGRIEKLNEAEAQQPVQKRRTTT